MSKFTDEKTTLSKGGTKQPVFLEDIAKMQRALADVNIPLIVELGRTEMTVDDVGYLKEGDVIRLDQKATDDLLISINGVPKFLGKPGTIGNRRGVTIV